MSQNEIATQKRHVMASVHNKLIVASVASLPLFAMAAEGDGALDMTSATAVLVTAVAAVGALGAAKVAPAALTWVWSLVTGMAKRG